MYDFIWVLANTSCSIKNPLIRVENLIKMPLISYGRAGLANMRSSRKVPAAVDHLNNFSNAVS